MKGLQIVPPFKEEKPQKKDGEEEGPEIKNNGIDVMEMAEVERLIMLKRVGMNKPKCFMIYPEDRFRIWWDVYITM